MTALSDAWIFADIKRLIWQVISVFNLSLYTTPLHNLAKMLTEIDRLIWYINIKQYNDDIMVM